VSIFDPVDIAREADREATRLATERYRQTLGKFVKRDASRLAYVDTEVTRCARECAEAVGADPERVEGLLREVISADFPDEGDAVGVTKPDRVDPSGATSEMKNETGQPFEVEKSDIRASEPVLDEIEPDGRVDMDDTTADTAKHTKSAAGKGHKPGCSCGFCKSVEELKRKKQDGDSGGDKDEIEVTAPEITSCFRCEKEAAAEESLFCAECEGEIVKRAYMPIHNVVCPTCGTTMQPSQTPQGPAQNQYTCPNDGTTIQVAPPAGQQPGAQPGMQQGQGAPGAYAAVKTAEPSGPGGDYDDPSAMNQSPAEEAPSDEAKLPPAARPDAGADEHTPSGIFDQIVQNMANVQAAMTWSTPGDDDVAQIAREYGLGDDEVRSNLKIVANFGDAISVNGEAHGDTDVAGYVELDNFGGRIPETEEEVSTDNAVTAAADKLRMDPESVYGQLKESYGGDLGGQYYVSVGGEAHYYLPAEMVHSGRGRQPAETPGELREPQPVASVASLAEFIEWDRQRTAERLAAAV